VGGGASSSYHLSGLASLPPNSVPYGASAGLYSGSLASAYALGSASGIGTHGAMAIAAGAGEVAFTPRTRANIAAAASAAVAGHQASAAAAAAAAGEVRPVSNVAAGGLSSRE
jgi:hypothetical protein